jgi:hypothetical protein
MERSTYSREIRISVASPFSHACMVYDCFVKIKREGRCHKRSERKEQKKKVFGMVVVVR